MLLTKGKNPEPSSDLWDLVLDMDWPGVIRHARSAPQDADFLEGHWQETPLYLSCQLEAPIRTLRAVIDAHPAAVRISSRENRDLPIHIACRYQAETPVLEALLEDYPMTATETTKWGLTPMMTLWNFRDAERNHRGVTAVPNENDHFWKKVMVLLRAAARARSMSKNNIVRAHRSKASQEQHVFFVHAAVSLGARGCPIEVLSHVIDKFPKQVFQRDRRDDLPLHVAIQKVSWSKHKKRRLVPKERPFLRRLLETYPGAARERIWGDYGRYPLHSAIGNGHTWPQGVRDIFLAAPGVLLVRDPFTGLFPFQLAGVPIPDDNANGLEVLETVYELLRAQPGVLFYLQNTSRRTKKNRNPAAHPKNRNGKKTKKSSIFGSLGERLFGT